MNGDIPFAARALLSWKRLQVTGEGGPVSRVAVMATGDRLEEAGRDESAKVIICSMDMYLRVSDWGLVEGPDVVGEATGWRSN